MLRSALAFFLIAAALPAQEPAQVDIKRVVLYKNGIGYFELDGSVTGNREVSLSFPSGQLNDVLKTITVLDLNGGRIAGIGYASQPPVGRQLGELPLPQANDAALRDFLLALKGARVEIKSGTSLVTGRLLSVERKTRITNSMSQEVDLVSLLTEAGELRTVELGPAVNLRLLEKSLTPQMDRYLDIVSSTRAADLRTMTIRTEGQGERRIFVSYISETPVWKATYRLVLGGKAGTAPLLQGWAIVDNTSGQDWKNVSLSLVAGAPQSFIQELSKPYYSRRPVVAMPESYLSAPQTHQRTLTPGGGSITGVVRDPTGAAVPGAVVRTYDAAGNVAGETTTDSNGQYAIAGLPDGVYRNEVQASGFQRSAAVGIEVNQATPTNSDTVLAVGSSNMMTMVAAAPPPPAMREVAKNRLGTGANVGTGRGAITGTGSGGGIGTGYGSGIGAAMDSVRPSATAQTVGELFEYKLKEPITIERNRSALVPIIQSPIGAEKISLWNAREGGVPLRSVWLTNSTGSTLDGGTFAVLEDQTFAGEGIIEALQAGEKRIVSYAADLALNVNATQAMEPQRVSRVKIADGILTQFSELRERKVYKMRNEDSQARTVLVEHPVRPGYTMRNAPTPAETTPQWVRFRIPVAAKQTAELSIDEARPISNTFQLSGFSRNELNLFIRQKSISPEIQEMLSKIVAQRDKVTQAEATRNEHDNERTEIFEDQQRLRENMKSLKGSPEEKELLRRYTTRLNEQESRLEALIKILAEDDAAIEREQAELDKLVKSFSIDTTL
ncbi:MAG: carboxypeptidase regulatory-like domain-containing protein [Bryobacteraceae bacterium]|nr:carboxypeptidase regulatory-like domain-containing protein [Bryobacteraceae bacterium]